MRLIKREDLEERWPNNCNPKVFSMSDNVAKYYLVQYNLYEHFLYQYLLKKTSLSKFDEEISNNKLKIDRVNIAKKDFYQIGSPLKYLYIRNNLYVERLEEKDVKLLENKMLNGDSMLDDEIESLIERTYKIIISEKIENENTSIISYGPTTKRFFALNGNLVIGIRYDNEVKSSKDNNEYKRQNNISSYIFELSSKLDNTLSKELNIGVCSIVYTDNSIIRRNNIK